MVGSVWRCWMRGFCFWFSFFLLIVGIMSVRLLMRRVLYLGELSWWFMVSRILELGDGLCIFFDGILGCFSVVVLAF